MANSPDARPALFRSVSRGICLLVFINLLPADAQAPKTRLKPTELVVKRYERLILRGDLLTPEGWKRASELFTAAGPYPQNGEIRVNWTGTNVLGENWNDGSRAEVSTKWNDMYGTIDSELRFKPYSSSRIAMAEMFSLSCVRSETADSRVSDSCSGKWKIAETLRYRSADIPQAIRYIEEMRNRFNDPEVQKNAVRAIAALKRLSRSCGTGSAC